MSQDTREYQRRWKQSADTAVAGEEMVDNPGLIADNPS